MLKRERSPSAAVFAFGLSVCLTLGSSACSSGSEEVGSSEPFGEQTGTDRTQSPAHQERMREMEDRNGDGGGY
jgi:hypothetical protein